MIELINRIIAPIDHVISHKSHAIFPGSYNPLHFGHIGMAQEVRSKFKLEPVFAINTIHPDKGQLSKEECFKRSLPINENGYSVMFTEYDRLFVDKAKKFQGYHFVIGADTLERLFDQKYGIGVRELLDKLKGYQTKFICFDRIVNGKKLSAGKIINEILKPNMNFYLYMFTFGNFVMDISSTEIRAQNGKQ